MKRAKKLLLALAFSVCLTFVAPTNTPIVQTAQAAKTVTINKKSATLYVGKTTTLKLKNTSKKPTWTTSNKKVATVSKSGKVTAKKAGKVTITAKIGKKTYKCKITVKAKKKVPAVKVWISATGSKYHSINHCGRMNPNKARSMTKSAAQQAGYDPCSKCY